MKAHEGQIWDPWRAATRPTTAKVSREGCDETAQKLRHQNHTTTTPKHPNRESLSCLCMVEDLRWLGSEIQDPRGKNHKPTPTNLNSPAYNNHHQAPSKPRKTINPPTSLSLSITSIYGFISLFFFSTPTARFELLTSRSAPSSSRFMPLFFSVVADMWVCRWVMIFFSFLALV